MQFSELIDSLCTAIDARHTGCEIEASDDDIRLVRTFYYPCARDLLITDVLRAVASPNWRQALADAQAALIARIDAYEERRRLEESRKTLRWRIGTSDPRSGIG